MNAQKTVIIKQVKDVKIATNTLYRGFEYSSAKHQDILGDLCQLTNGQIYLSDAEKQLSPLKEILSGMSGMTEKLAYLESKKKLNEKLSALALCEKKETDTNFFSSVHSDILSVATDGNPYEFVNHVSYIVRNQTLVQQNIYKAIIELIVVFTEITKNEHTAKSIKNTRFWEQVNEHFQKLLEAYF